RADLKSALPGRPGSRESPRLLAGALDLLHGGLDGPADSGSGPGGEVLHLPGKALLLVPGGRPVGCPGGEALLLALVPAGSLLPPVPGPVIPHVIPPWPVPRVSRWGEGPCRVKPRPVHGPGYCSPSRRKSHADRTTRLPSGRISPAGAGF